MKSRFRLPLALSIAALLAASSATAQGPGPDRGRPGGDRPHQQRPDFRPDHRPGQAQRPGPRPGQRPAFRPDGPPPGPQWSHRYQRGERLPPYYRHRQYVVDDWRVHHLSRPPRGHHWVQIGGDYVLIAIATGIITAVVLSH